MSFQKAGGSPAVLAILRALGLEGRPVHRLTLDLRPDRVVSIDVEEMVEVADLGRLAEVLRRFDLVEREDDRPPGRLLCDPFAGSEGKPLDVGQLLDDQGAGQLLDQDLDQVAGPIAEAEAGAYAWSHDRSWIFPTEADRVAEAEAGQLLDDQGAGQLLDQGAGQLLDPIPSVDSQARCGYFRDLQCLYPRECVRYGCVLGRRSSKDDVEPAKLLDGGRAEAGSVEASVCGGPPDFADRVADSIGRVLGRAWSILNAPIGRARPR